MKKLLLLSLALILGPFCLQAQNPVLNPSFESWTQGNPDNWLTNNITGLITTITQVSPGNTGSNALKGEVISFSGTNLAPVLYSSPGGAGSGFPMTQAFNNIRFYYKFVSITAGDEIQMFAVIQDANGNGIAAGGGSVAQVSSVFTQANVPIVYSGSNPANGVLTISIANTQTNTPSLGCYFIIDDVSLDFSSGITENTNTGIGTIYPNPATSAINIPFHQTASDKVTLAIYDMQGRLIREIVNENPGAGVFKTIENISDLEDGMYECLMRTSTGTFTAPFQVCH